MPTTFLDDTSLIAAIQAGGIARTRATNRLYTEYFRYVWKALKTHRINQEQAEDAYGDAIQSVCRQLQEGIFRQEAQISTFLYQVFERRIVDILRSEKTEKAIQRRKTEREIPTHLRSPLADPEERFIQQELFLRLEQILPRAGTKCKEILMDMLYYGYSAKETAKRVDLKNAGTVRVTKKKCLDKAVELAKK